MICETIELKEFYSCVQGGRLEILCLDNPLREDEHWVRPAVIVAPGGAYRRVSKREGEPIAADFFAKGYQVAVLDYLCYDRGASYPEQIFELACAVDYLRKNAAHFHLNPQEIFAVGFSAGGHLVADFSNEYPSLPERAGVALDCAVTAVGLSYPVIDDHEESFDYLLFGYGEEEKAKFKEELKLTAKVGGHTPPTFLWTTAEDKLVPPQNTLRYALALADHAVPYECHVYQKGGHGMANGSLEINDDQAAAAVLSAWTADMARFFRSYCREKF